MIYYSKQSPEIEAIQIKNNVNEVLSWLHKYDPSGAFYKCLKSERKSRNGFTFYIDITENVESMVPANAYIILRDEPTKFSKFRWHSEKTFNTFYSTTKLT